MTEYGFFQNFARMKSVYGDDAFPPAREKIILERLKRLTDDEFRIVCDTVIGENRYAPTLKEFEKAAKAYLDAAFKREEYSWNQTLKDRRAAGQTCKTCDDSGHVSAILNENRHAASFSFRCPVDGCIASERFVRTPTPVWSEFFAKRYTLVTGNKTPHQVWETLFEDENPVVTDGSKPLDFDGLTHVSKVNFKRTMTNDDDFPPAG